MIALGHGIHLQLTIDDAQVFDNVCSVHVISTSHCCADGKRLLKHLARLFVITFVLVGDAKVVVGIAHGRSFGSVQLQQDSQTLLAVADGIVVALERHAGDKCPPVGLGSVLVHLAIKFNHRGQRPVQTFLGLLGQVEAGVQVRQVQRVVDNVRAVRSQRICSQTNVKRLGQMLNGLFIQPSTALACSAGSFVRHRKDEVCAGEFGLANEQCLFEHGQDRLILRVQAVQRRCHVVECVCCLHMRVAKQFQSNMMCFLKVVVRCLVFALVQVPSTQLFEEIGCLDGRRFGVTDRIALTAVIMMCGVAVFVIPLHIVDRRRGGGRGGGGGGRVG